MDGRGSRAVAVADPSVLREAERREREKRRAEYEQRDE
jgi:hypothetical protein